MASASLPVPSGAAPVTASPVTTPHGISSATLTPTGDTIPQPKSLSPSNSHSNNLHTNATTGGSVPSVIVKPATPSPKLHPAVTPTTTPAAKMALLVKNRLEEPMPDPVTCAITPGKETTIEINKDKMGLGLSIVGGCDTLLVRVKLKISPHKT